MQNAAKRLAKALLKWMKSYTPVGDTYQLISGWNGNNFAVKKVANGFEVLIVNKDEKALWVNDGHRVRNREKGTYLTVHRRIQVPVAHQWQKDASNMYVFGHFFVEKGILRMTENTEIESIIMQELQKWWDSV
jgi:hypothetical protein